MQKTFLQFHFVLFLLCVLSRTQSAWSEVDEKAGVKSEQTARVGAILTLSGNFSAIGADGNQGISAALDEHTSALKITTIVADSKGDATTAVSEFRRLVDIDDVVAVYAFRGPVGMSINPISKSSRIPLLGGVGNKEFAASNDYAFQLWPRSDVEGKFLAENVYAFGLRNPALITVQDDWTTSVSAGFRQAYLKLGGSIALEKEVIPNEQDFRLMLQQLRTKNVDALVINVAISQIGPLLKQKRELKIDLPTFSNFWVGKKEVIETAGIEGAEGVMFNEMSTDMPKLKALLSQKFKSVPSGATLSAYLGMKLLLQAAEGMKGPFTSSKMQAELTKQKEIVTPDRVFPIENRCVEFPLTMKVIRNGKAETLATKS